MKKLRSRKLEQSLWNRALLGRLSPKQRRERENQLQRTRRKQSRKKLRDGHKSWLQNFRERFQVGASQQPQTRPLLRKPILLCAVCLYRVGLDKAAITKKLNITAASASQIIFRTGVQRKLKHRPVVRFLSDRRVNKLIVEQYRRETHALRCLDETQHWWKHPECEAWLKDLRAEKNRETTKKSERKSYLSRLAKKLAEFKCQFCGKDASSIPSERKRLGLIFCSEKCRKKARTAAEKLRLKSDPQFWQRKNEAAKRCYHRTRQERPEVHESQMRRKLANPQNRISKAHRLRIYLLVKNGRMIKTQTSLKYFGCTRAHLKQHLIKQFKPGMTWENYGKVWQVDHIIPLASFDLLKPTECAIAFNWQNLQPMFALTNRIKSNKITHPQLPLPLVID